MLTIKSGPLRYKLLMTYGVADDNYREHRLLVSLRFGWIQRGEHNLTVMNIVKIAAALQVKPSELLGSAGL